MGNESGEWIMYGVADDDPECVHNFDELTDFVRETGFIPLFRSGIPGFSVEEHCSPRYWWTDDEERDPWQWRKLAARSREMAYGKFFGGKAGFISLEWLPVFMSHRRNGYDFEALWYDGLAQFRWKKIMDLLTKAPELPGWELKQRAGFGSGGERNFSGSVTALQDMLYILISGFRQRRNKFGISYGWDVSVYARPEQIWSGIADEAYRIPPSEAQDMIRDRMDDRWPGYSEKAFRELLGSRNQRSGM